MEIKTKYQYTYFIYPYLVEKNKMGKYLCALLKNPKCKLKIFNKFQDTDIYTYFLPKVRDYMFPTFEFDKERLNTLKSLDYSMMGNLLSKYPCMMFDYKLDIDIQGKTDEKQGIFFRINDIKVICFNTGICFMLIKTALDEDSTFGELCNFNYRFRDINSSVNKLNDFENIKIQTNLFKNKQDLLYLIKKITGNNKDIKDLNINTERFVTYSYACIGQEDWKQNLNNGILDQEFNRFADVLSTDSSISVDKNKKISESETYKLGITSAGVTLLASDEDINNYTKIPHKFENEMLYHYIFEMYKKINIKLVSNSFLGSKDEFIEFVNNVWIEQITDDKEGNKVKDKIEESLKLNETFFKAKQKYEILYKESKIRKSITYNRKLLIFLIVIAVFELIILLF